MIALCVKTTLSRLTTTHMARLSAVALAALQQADREGLTLLPADNLAGFKYVSLKRGRPEPFEAQLTRDGRQISLGHFATAEEAALCYARQIAANGPPKLTLPAPLTAAEALRQAAAEGLTLQPSDNAAGFRGVVFDSRVKAKPYQPQVRRGGKKMLLGYYATAEEAALCYARCITANGAPKLTGAVAAAAAPAPLRQAKAEGLTLQPGQSNNAAGFKGVSFNGSEPRPYKAELSRGGTKARLGAYETAEEAALWYARKVATSGPPAKQAKRAKVAAQEEEVMTVVLDGVAVGAGAV